MEKQIKDILIERRQLERKIRHKTNTINQLENTVHRTEEQIETLNEKLYKILRNSKNCEALKCQKTISNNTRDNKAVKNAKMKQKR